MSHVFAFLALHAALLTGPFLTAAEVTSRRTTDRATVLGGGLLGVGLASWAGGIAWYVSPTLGRVLTWMVPLSCVVYLFLRRRRLIALPSLRAAGYALAASVWYAAFVLCLGFLWGGLAFPLDMPAGRFSSPLPNDNRLPLEVASHVAVYGHATAAPVAGDWLSSDRPPLQSAAVLSQAVTGVPSDLQYTVTGVLLQSLWVVGVLAMLAAFRVRRRVTLLATIAVGASGIALVNTFFVWPKLLAAAFALAAVGLILRPVGRTAGGLVMAASLCGMAYLSHGGIAFLLLPLAVCFVVDVFRLRTARIRTATWSALCAGAVVLPWAAYQRFADPPGDRLLKWMLAGQIPVDSRPFATVALEQYATLGLAGAVEYRLQNLGVLFVWSGPNHSTLAEAAAGWEPLLRLVREQAFFSTAPSVGLLMLGALGWWRPRGGTELGASRRLAGVGIVSLALWCLLMFGPSTTVNHQGTYAIQLLFVVGLVCAAYCRSQRFATRLVGAWVLLNGLLYVPFIAQSDGLDASAMVALCVTVLLGVVSLARSVGPHRTRDRGSTSSGKALADSPAGPARVGDESARDDSGVVT